MAGLMITDWKRLKEEFFRFGYRRLVKRTYKLPDGRTTDFDVVDGGRVVCILALTGTNQVVLAKQYRPGPEIVLLELPGGGADEDEEPLEAARREVLEETGYDGASQFVGTSTVGGYATTV